jgi:beta-glucosidase
VPTPPPHAILRRFPWVALILSCLPSLVAPPDRLAAQTGVFNSPAANARIDGLLGRMTLEEKAGQLNQVGTDNSTGPGRFFQNSDEMIREGRIGAILGVVTARQANAYQKEAVEGSRLHVPILFGLDVIHGFRTIFPIPLGLSASWDPDLVEQTARFAAREASAQGVRWTFSPMVDIARDARWGRMSEGAGEDPFLGSIMARAYVRGYQGKSLGDPASIVACAKHFVGYGAAEGGREYNSTEIPERLLRDVYLPPFHAAVEQGAGTLMSAFNSINGVPASANSFTLTQVLRREWGFAGFVDSDWTAVRELMLHGIADDERTAARKGFVAGVDMDMQSGLFIRYLPDLVRSGQVPVERLNGAVRGILRVKVALGLFERPYVDPSSAQALALRSSAGSALARRAAEESFVLLENRKVAGSPLLPLAATPGRSIALLGPLADSPGDMLGCWSCQGDPKDMVTLRAAMADRAARLGMRLSYAKGTDIFGVSESGFAKAVELAGNSDVVVMALGESRSSSGEAASRSDLNLQGNQEKLLEAVVAAGKPVVLVVFSGRPLALPWASAHVPAILTAWFPGEQAGPALADVLFGDGEPTGRLTVSIPRSVGQEPIYYNTLNTGRPRVDPIGYGGEPLDARHVTGYIDLANTPQYPFGYGLGYSTFEYSPVAAGVETISARAIERGEALSVAADVRNTGDRPGTETAQLYIRWRGTSVARPVRELKGYERVRLAPGESRRLSFKLGREELAFWNIDMKRAVEPGSLYIWIAPDSARGTPARVQVTE